MNVHHRPNSLKAPSSITIGNFDGVHVGHAAVLKRLVAMARERGLAPTVITFAPNPKAYFAHKLGISAPTQIMPLRDKIAAMKQLGIEQVVVLPFDAHLASMPAETFVSEILIRQLNAKLLLVGDDFRFGVQRKGDFALLQSLQSCYGYLLENLHSVEQNGVRISSSVIREHLANGDLAQAIQMLGHPLTLSGHIIHGEKLGRTIGVPTINIKMPERLALQGIYAASVQLQSAPEQIIQGAASIGIRPSVKTNGQCWCEVHLFDFNQEIYGQIACVTLHQKIRDEAKFDDFEQLLKAIQNDIVQCRTFFAQT